MDLISVHWVMNQKLCLSEWTSVHVLNFYNATHTLDSSASPHCSDWLRVNQ